MKPKNVIILGAAGNCFDIVDVINECNKNVVRYKLLGFLDDDKSKHNKLFFNHRVLGPLSKSIDYQNVYFINGIGNSKMFYKKLEIIASTKLNINKFINLIHPKAVISNYHKMGHGNVILANCTVCNNVSLGSHIMMLPNSVINHDCIIGDGTIIASNVSISGNVKINKSCYLGTNSTIKENLTINENSLIGMGAVVINDVPTSSVMVGNPAKLLREVKYE